MSKSHDYRPASGTFAHLAIAWMRTQPQGVWHTASAICAALGIDKPSIGQYLDPSVRAGLLSRKREGGVLMWRLGTNSDPSIAPPDDGDTQTVRSVSANAVPSVFAYAQQRHAAPFSVALHTDGRLVAERHGRPIAEFTDEERRVLVKAAAEGVTP